jgi:hypothetical protein
MARRAIKIHGGDFTGECWFAPGEGLILHDREGKLQRLVSLERIAVADSATEETTIRTLGADDALVRVLKRVPAEEKIGPRYSFIAKFHDGRLLLASADLATYNEICGGRRLEIQPASAEKDESK